MAIAYSFINEDFFLFISFTFHVVYNNVPVFFKQTKIKNGKRVLNAYWYIKFHYSFYLFLCMYMLYVIFKNLERSVSLLFSVSTLIIHLLNPVTQQFRQQYGQFEVEELDKISTNSWNVLSLIRVKTMFQMVFRYL